MSKYYVIFNKTKNSYLAERAYDLFCETGQEFTDKLIDAYRYETTKEAQQCIDEDLVYNFRHMEFEVYMVIPWPLKPSVDEEYYDV